MTRLIALSVTVARLSVRTTESMSRPDCRPSDEVSRIVTRLGWLVRPSWLLIMATMAWLIPVCKPSAWTTGPGVLWRRLDRSTGTSLG